MGVRYTSTDVEGTTFEWELRRNGKLYARESGKQRWRLLGQNFTKGDVRAFVLDVQGHKEVH